MDIQYIYNDKECQICFQNFVKFNSKEYYEYLENNKHLLDNNFEDDTCCRLYEDRFECLVCKNIVCRKCYWSFKGHKYKPQDEDDIEDAIYFGLLDENGLIDAEFPGDECPLICPFCKTTDYKIYYAKCISYELSNEIKKYKLRINTNKIS